MAILVLYFFLALFFWMLVEGIHVYLMVKKVFDITGRKIKYFYCTIGWSKFLYNMISLWQNDNNGDDNAGDDNNISNDNDNYQKDHSDDDNKCNNNNDTTMATTATTTAGTTTTINQL